MKEFKELLPAAVYEIVNKRFINLRRFAKIEFSVLEINPDAKTAVIRIQQIERLTDQIYTAKEMHDFAREFMDILENEGWTIHLRPVEYVVSGLDYVTAAWVKEQIKTFELSQRKLAGELDVDEFTISRLLKGKFGFTKWHKAAFYYYFQSLKAGK